MSKKEIIKKFDKKFPPYEGGGASFPIFEEIPNRKKIRMFIASALKEQRQRILEIALKDVPTKYQKNLISALK